MHVAVIQVELTLPGLNGLKEKRRIVKPLLNTLRRRFEVAASEVGALDAWRTSMLGIALVSNDARHARERAQSVLAFLDDLPEAALSDSLVEIL